MRLLVLALALLGGDPPDRGARNRECGRCHAEIWREWSGSLHARALTERVFVDQWEGASKNEECVRCHAPASVPATGMPEARKDARDQGVDCLACHVDAEGRVRGTLGTAWHGARRKEDLAKPAACDPCHHEDRFPFFDQGTSFAKSPAAREGKTCQSCHMPEVERRVANGKEGDALPPRRHRSHRLTSVTSAADLAAGYRLSLERVGGKLVARLESTAGHDVPGGAGRALILELAVLDAQGKELRRQALTWAWRFNPLVAGKPAVRELALPPGAAVARARLVHYRVGGKGDGPENRTVVAERELKLD